MPRSLVAHPDDANDSSQTFNCAIANLDAASDSGLHSVGHVVRHASCNLLLAHDD